MTQLFPALVPEPVRLDGAPLLWLWRDAFAGADAIWRSLHDSLPWQQPQLTLYGRTHPLPRLQSWHGDAAYRYSGRLFVPEPWTPLLLSLRRQTENLTGRRYNSVLCNLYRDGKDHLGWHADDEAELGGAPWIASASFGAERDFCLRHRGQHRQALKLSLPHNSLLLMAPALQQHWQHSVPARTRLAAPRINLTFRLLQVSA